MSCHSFTNQIQRSVVTLTASLALFVSPLTLAQTASVDKRASQNGPHALSAQNIVVTDSEGGENQTLEIRVVGDKVTVIRDGKEVPQPQITEGDDKIIITDKDGKRLREIKLRLKKDGEGLSFYGVGDADFKWEDHAGMRRLLGQVKVTTPPVMLGVNMSTPGPALEKHLGLEPGTCTMISGVYEGLPAHQAGLGEYDIIVKVDGKTPADNETIRTILAERKAGDTIRLTVIQEGRQKEVTVELKEYDANAMSKAKLLGSAANEYRFWTTEGVPHMSYYTGQLPRVFFAPEQGLIDADQFKPLVENLHESYRGEVSKARPDVEQQLQRLDERLAELEKLLQKLAERRESNR